MKLRFSLFALMTAVTLCAAATQAAIWTWQSCVIPNQPIPWTRFSPDAFQQARRSGKVVLVHFISRDNLESLFSLNAVLETSSVRKEIYVLDVAPMLAEVSHNNDARRFADAYARQPLPLTIVFPSSKTTPAAVLSRLPSSSQIVQALQFARQPRRT